MERKRKCCVCGKELDVFDGHSVLKHVSGSRTFPMDSGGADLYCDECYKKNFSEVNKLIEEANKSESGLHERVLKRIKSYLEKDSREITIIKDENSYRIKAIIRKE